MIKHSEYDKQVRERASDDPGLVRDSHAVREVIHLACSADLPLRGSLGLELPQIHPRCTTVVIETCSV